MTAAAAADVISFWSLTHSWRPWNAVTARVAMPVVVIATRALRWGTVPVLRAHLAGRDVVFYAMRADRQRTAATDLTELPADVLGRLAIDLVVSTANSGVGVDALRAAHAVEAHWVGAISWLVVGAL